MSAYTNDSDYNNGLGVSSLYFIDDTSRYVIGPGSNTANYIPQWSGTDSKTLIDGIDITTLSTLTGTEALTNKTLTSATNDIAAKGLLSATTNVDVYSAAAPSAGQVLTATSSSNAQWTTPSANDGYTVASITNYTASLATSSSNVTLSHSLSVIPKKITLLATYSGNGTDINGTVYNYYSGTMNSIFLNYTTNVCNTIISYGLYLNNQMGSMYSGVYDSTNTIFQAPTYTGTITDITSTNFTINFTPGGTAGHTTPPITCSGTLKFLLEA